MKILKYNEWLNESKLSSTEDSNFEFDIDSFILEMILDENPNEDFDYSIDEDWAQSLSYGYLAGIQAQKNDYKAEIISLNNQIMALNDERDKEVARQKKEGIKVKWWKSRTPDLDDKIWRLQQQRNEYKREMAGTSGQMNGVRTGYSAYGSSFMDSTSFDDFDYFYDSLLENILLEADKKDEKEELRKEKEEAAKELPKEIEAAKEKGKKAGEAIGKQIASKAKSIKKLPRAKKQSLAKKLEGAKKKYDQAKEKSKALDKKIEAQKEQMKK
jgi:hypothetical protein